MTPETWKLRWKTKASPKMKTRKKPYKPGLWWKSFGGKHKPMPLAKRTLPENEPLVVGTKYVFTGIEKPFDLRNGGKGLLVNTTVGLRRTTSKIIISRLTDPGTTFPVEATVIRKTSKNSGKSYQDLQE